MMSRKSGPQLPQPHPLTLALLLAIAAGASQASESAEPQRDPTFDAVEVVEPAPAKASSGKLTAPLLDTPQTIAVISADVFNAQGARNLTEVLRNTPGISFSGGENGFSTDTNNFSLRGFDTSGSIFVDGVRDSGNYPRDVFNLESVEVAKGPAADFGRGGLAGYVNLVSKSPKAQDFSRGTASFGIDQYDSDARARTTLDLNRQLNEGTAVRLNLLAQVGGIAGRERAQAEAFGIAPSLAFGLDGDTQVTFSAQHLNQSGRPDWGVPAATIPGTVNYNPDAGRASRDNFYGLVSDYDDNESTMVTLRVDHKLSPSLNLSNQLRWGQAQRDSAYTAPTGYTAATQVATAGTFSYGRVNHSLSNLTNLSASFDTGSFHHTLATGLEFSRERSDADRYPTVTAPTTPILNPDPRRSSLSRPNPTESAGVDIDTVAFYVYDTVELAQRWQLTGGARVERYEVDLESRNAAGAPIGPNGYSVSETTVSGKLGLVYKPVEHGSVYASFGVATLPPGSYLSNPDISRTGDNAFPGLLGQNNESAKPQRAVNHEVGVKWAFFDERLQVNAAAFSTERRSVAVSGKEPGVPSSPTLLRGYSKLEVQGVELGVNGRIGERWQILAGLVVLDSERKLDPYLDAARREANPADYGTFLTANGDQLAFTPEVSANLWTTYRFDSGLTLGLGAQYVDDSFAGRPDDADRIIPNGRFGELPGYTVGNLMLSYPVNQNLSLRLNVDNVTDRTYAVAANWPVARAQLGTSRAYLLSADFNF